MHLIADDIRVIVWEDTGSTDRKSQCCRSESVGEKGQNQSVEKRSARRGKRVY